MSHNAEISIYLRPPYFGKEERFCISLDPEQYRELAQPLPKNREFDFTEASKTREITVAREELARDLSRVLTQAILEMIARGDTVNGYTFKENQQFFHPPGTPGGFDPDKKYTIPQPKK